QRRVMHDNDFPFYHVAIWPRSHHLAGTAIDGLFVAFVKPEASVPELRRDLSHEMFHNWLGNRFRISDDSDPTGQRYNWMHEGVTEFVAREILLNAGLIERSYVVSLFNRDLADIADNPHARADIAEVEAASREGRWESAYNKL